jgi:GLPGLI family protein
LVGYAAGIPHPAGVPPGVIVFSFGSPVNFKEGMFMNTSGFRSTVILVLSVVVAVAASAQGLHWSSTTTTMGKELKNDFYLMPKMMKTVTAEHEALVLRLDKKMIYEINPSAKEYAEMTFDEFDQLMQKVKAKTNAMQDKMKDQMKNMPEAQRKMMEQMMGGQETAATTKNTGETKKIAGYTCTKYTISQGEKEVMTVWSTPDVKEFAAMRKDYEEFAKRAMGNAPGLTKVFGEMMKLQGFAMETQMGTMMNQTVTSVEKRSTPAPEFEVPSGYKKVKSKLQEQVDKAAGPEN